MKDEEKRTIPGYEGYEVTRDGRVFSRARGIELGRYMLHDYWIVDTFRGSLTETLPIHRAVALAWVHNPDPESLRIVNHKNGVKTDNRDINLEWSNYSQNNYHAIANGLRNDAIGCRIRDQKTKEVLGFPSMAQAASYMGLGRDAAIHALHPKKFGSLVRDRYEFRFSDDGTPWFYEERNIDPVSTRYLVEVHYPDGRIREFYSSRDLLKEFQIYRAPYGKSIAGLVRYANEVFPDLRFRIRDSYHEERYRPHRDTRPSIRMPIDAEHLDGDVERFSSLTECARFFNVDRSVILSRLDRGKEYDGWFFQTATLRSNA